MSSPKMYVSPRIGISIPISESGAFRVAYGHFTQMPAYSRLFQNPVDENTNQGRLLGTTVGNSPICFPNEPSTMKWGCSNNYPTLLESISTSTTKMCAICWTLKFWLPPMERDYFRTVNRDYGLIKGGTIALVTRPSGMLQSLGFDVTYEDARGSSSNPAFIADVIVAGRAGGSRGCCR